MRRVPASRKSRIVSLLALAFAFTYAVAFAGKPVPTDAEIARLVADLDAPEFFTREATARRLRALVVDSQFGPTIAARLEAASLSTDISYEAQELVAEILRGVDLKQEVTSDVLTPEAAAALVQQLVDDRFTVREKATRQLRWLLRNEANIVPLLQNLKVRLGDPAASSATRQELEQRFDEARRAWLQATPEKLPLPEVSDEQMAAWALLVGQATDREATFAAQRVAQRELEDLLVREKYRERVTRVLEDALKNTTDPAGRSRLRDLVDLTRPAMVAEIWSSTRFVNWVGGVIIADGDPFSVRLATTQYLHVGVPQVPEGALKATHFDRCDEKTAHCVSGNTLEPGDYPVGSAFAHPQGDTTFFHLVNLPTPRRRLIYEYASRRSEAARLREISQRTCDAFVNKVRKLTEADITVLMLLDRAVVGNFVGTYFANVDDGPLEGLGNRLPIGQTTTHGGVCYALAFVGTKDAAPGIIKAIGDKRLSKSESGSPYHLPLIALLAIAHRDPWPEVNTWLARQIESDVSLIDNVDPAPELAATAAAILCDRLGQSPQSLGLTAAHDGFCQQIGLPIYRFESEEHRAAARSWAKSQKQEAARAGS